MSSWGTWGLKGNTISNRNLCWNLARQNVPGAVGIYWSHEGGHCQAIDSLAALGPWKSTYPDAQAQSMLCLFKQGIQNPDLQSGYRTYVKNLFCLPFTVTDFKIHI